MDGADPDPWSDIADGWSELWARFAEPAWTAVLDVVEPRRGDRVLDVGCGSGELLAHLDGIGLTTSGIDPASGMVAKARTRAPRADIRLGDAENLPWDDAAFDLVIAVNSLQLAEDTLDAFAELVRVTVPGGHVAIVNWAEGSLNDLDRIEAAVARAAGDEPRADGDLRKAGALEQLLGDGGLELIKSGLVDTPWSASDDDTLVRGILLGEDAANLATSARTVISAAQPFRTADGGYRMLNRFRYAVGRTSG